MLVFWRTTGDDFEEQRLQFFGDRAAFAFARKQALTPAALTPQDFQELVRHFGKERALDVVWWACRCHYMTRVADAFQLPLERENVFEGYFPPAKAK